MINKTKLLRCAFFAIFILILVEFAFSVNTEVGRQVSVNYTGTDHDLIIKSNDNSIARLEVVVYLSSAPAVDPTFNIQIGTDSLSPVIDGPFVWTGTIADSDGVRVIRTGAAGDRDRFSVIFLLWSYYDFNGIHGAGCGPYTTDFERDITISMTGLVAGEHLQAYVHSDTTVLTASGCEYSPSDTDLVNFIQDLADPTAKKPIDVILVLDVSGSMIGKASTDPLAPQKIEILHEGSQDFLDLWGSGTMFDPNDHVGAVFFSTTPSPYLGAGPFLVQFTSTPTTDTAWLNINNEVYTRPAGGMTAMGGGLQEALDRFDDGSENLRHIILFTNGMQNQTPMVLDSTDPSYDYKTLNGHFLRSYGVPIYTIGAGVITGSAYEELLQDIAEQTGATSTFTDEIGTDLDPAYFTSLVNMMRGNSPAIVGINSGIINKGDGVITHTYQVNRAAKNGVFIVTWHAFDAADKTPTSSALSMEVIGPGTIGTLTSAQGVLRSRNHSHIHSVAFPLSSFPADAHEGTWTIRITESLVGPKAYYHSAVLVDEAELFYRVGAAPGDYGTGENIILRAALSLEGQPVTGSAVKTVQCTVTHPRTALGTFLTNSHGLSDTDLSTNPPGVDPDTFPDAYSRKLYRLIEEKKLGYLLEPITDPVPVELFDDGNRDLHGDVKAGDGVYSALYKKTKTKRPGQYRFDFLVKGDHPVIGKFERNEVSSTIVRVKTPDTDKSEFYQDKLPGNKRLVTVIPLDQFGNFLGPGFERNITVESSVGTPSTIKDERVNGTYTTIVSDVDRDADPIYTFKLRGKMFFQGQIKPPKPKWIIGGYFGQNAPHNSLDIVYDSGTSFGGVIEYLFASRLSVLVAGGHNTFNSAVPGIDDLKVFNISANAKVYPVIGTFQFSIFGGGGFYMLDPGDDKFGINAGSAAEYRVNKWLSIEAKYNYHNVFTPGDNITFSTVQGGLRLRF